MESGVGLFNSSNFQEVYPSGGCLMQVILIPNFKIIYVGLPQTASREITHANDVPWALIAKNTCWVKNNPSFVNISKQQARSTLSIETCSPPCVLWY